MKCQLGDKVEHLYCPTCFMHCPHCHSDSTRVRRNQTTNLGYPLHFCRSCNPSFNERTGIPFNHIEVPTDIIFQVL